MDEKDKIYYDKLINDAVKEGVKQGIKESVQSETRMLNAEWEIHLLKKARNRIYWFLGIATTAFLWSIVPKIIEIISN